MATVALAAPRTARRRIDAPRAARRTLMVALIGTFLLFFLVPIVWLLLAPTKTTGTLVSQNPYSFGTFSDLRANWDALVAFQDGAVKTWLTNSIWYSLAALAVTLVVTIPAGYAMAKMEFAGRRFLLVASLVVMLMPTSALVLPLFLEMDQVGLVNSPLSVILPYSFFPFGVYLTYIYFSTAVPADLIAAAKIDGCGDFRAFWHIALPLASPVVALVGFFSFVTNWNNFFLPYVMLPVSDRYPMQVGLTQLLASTPNFNPVVSPDAAVSPPQLALATLVAVVPVLVVFLVAQRYLVTGLTAGGTKG
jgi:multiple sugar transport system permease protein